MAEPKNQMVKLAKNLTSIPEMLTRNAVSPCLDKKDLHALILSCKAFRRNYKNTYQDKKTALEMLHCVLNPTVVNQTQLIALLFQHPKQDIHGRPLYLIQNHGREVYLNKDKVEKTKTMRWSTNLLEAILRTGNFHLATLLFKHIPEKEKTEGLKKQINDLKSKGIWGMQELQEAYKHFLEPWPSLIEARNFDKLNRLSGNIGQAIKEHLPWLSLYLFCHRVSHSKANYSLFPNWVAVIRGDLVYEAELDLDKLGPDSITSLIKGLGETCGLEAAAQPAVSRFMYNYKACCAADSEAFKEQCRVLSLEMDKTIKDSNLEAPKLDEAPNSDDEPKLEEAPKSEMGKGP